MTKSELVTRLAERLNDRGTPLAVRDCEYAVKTLLDVMVEALGHRHRIEIRGFGTFSLSYRPARVGRNPKSGEQVRVPEKRVPHFKPGKDLRERVDLPND